MLSLLLAGTIQNMTGTVVSSSKLLMHQLYCGSSWCSAQQPPRHLDEVRAGTGLVIRQQLRRQVPSGTLELMLQHLPRLESIV